MSKVTPTILQTPAGQTIIAIPAGGGNGSTSEHHRTATAAEIAIYQASGQSIKTTAQHSSDRLAGTA